jgi:2-polyprenyl-3-methyl-5-hydroxy-6-metoxy-1,4-benzoquinol methylase
MENREPEAGMAEAWDDGNEHARSAWNANAEFWDKRMGEGNDFVDVLEWPAIERLLQPQAGERLLDIACGNGLTSRRLAQAGARVVASDFSEGMLAQARKRGSDGVEYRRADATNREELLGLGEAASFDGALCNMALMDMAEIAPLMQALAVLLKPGGRFVFTTMHPCFNNPAVVHAGELEDRNGCLLTTYSVKVSRYMTPYSQPGLAMRDQPEPHPYFHRPLQELLRPAFEAGLVLDGLEESAFSKGHPDGSMLLSWGGRFSEIPPVLVVRLKKPKF